MQNKNNKNQSILFYQAKNFMCEIILVINNLMLYYPVFNF